MICGSVNCYEFAKPEHNYIISVDCQEEGKDYNCVIVFDLEERIINAE